MITPRQCCSLRKEVVSGGGCLEVIPSWKSNFQERHEELFSGSKLCRNYHIGITPVFLNWLGVILNSFLNMRTKCWCVIPPMRSHMTFPLRLESLRSRHARRILCRAMYLCGVCPSSALKSRVKCSREMVIFLARLVTEIPLAIPSSIIVQASDTIRFEDDFATADSLDPSSVISSSKTREAPADDDILTDVLSYTLNALRCFISLHSGSSSKMEPCLCTMSFTIPVAAAPQKVINMNSHGLTEPGG